MNSSAAIDTAYSSTIDLSSPEVIFVILLIGGISLAIGLATYALIAWLTGRIFKKAGVSAWRAWVPVYNSWVILELGGKAGWWAILMLIPGVNIIAAIILYIALYNIGLKLNKSELFVLWAIFFPFVWYIWLAVDTSTWNPSAGAPSLRNPTLDNTSVTPPTPTPVTI